MLYCIFERKSVKRYDEKSFFRLLSYRKRTCRGRYEAAPVPGRGSISAAYHRNRMPDPVSHRDPLRRLRHVPRGLFPLSGTVCSRWRKILMTFAVFLFTVTYFFRIVHGDPVVALHPSAGFLEQFIKELIHVLYQLRR